MREKHRDAAAIDRLGSKAIRAYLGVAPSTLTLWRYDGVPNRYRKTLAMLGAIAGHAMPEMLSQRDE